MTVEADQAGAGERRRWVSPRVVVLLVVLTGLISGTVVLVDRLSPRDRGAPTTREAPAKGSGAGDGVDTTKSSMQGVAP